MLGVYVNYKLCCYNIFFKGFGFCEYSDPEAALRAMRLLSGFHVADKKLLVSCCKKKTTLQGKTMKQIF